jgi:hypothetical protein
MNAERSGALVGMMTDDERNKLERMLQHVDDGSRNLAHMLKLLTELRSVVMDDRRLLTCRAPSDARREVPADGGPALIH